MTHKTITWVAAIDGKRAHFYTKGEERRLGDLNHTLTARPIRIDVSGGRRDLGRVHERIGSARHIVEPRTSERVLEREAFVREVAHYLDDALAQGKYTRLIISAPPKVLGFLRKELSKRVKDVIALELDKDLMQLTPAQLQKHLEKIVYV